MKIFRMDKISDLLGNSDRMLTTASTEETILNTLSANGYTETHIAAIRQTWTDADNETRECKKAFDTKKEVYMKYQEAYGEAHFTYIKHVKCGKSICKENPQLKTKLGLTAPRARAFNGWYLQATDYYDRVLAEEEVVTAFGDYGDSRTSLEAGKQGVENANSKKEQYANADGHSQTKRIDRDRALTKLERQVRDFAMLCLHHFRDNPQLLEKLGFTVYSPGYKKKKNEEEPQEQPEQPTDPAAVEEPVEDPPTTDPQQVNDGTAGSGQ